MGTRNKAAALTKKMYGWKIPSPLSERSQGIYYDLLGPIWGINTRTESPSFQQVKAL